MKYNDVKKHNPLAVLIGGYNKRIAELLKDLKRYEEWNHCRFANKISKIKEEIEILKNKKGEILKMQEESKKIFCDGLRVEEKQISQDFKIIKLGIKAEPFMDFLAKYTNEKGYVNIDIKTSKGGKLYAELNTYGMSKTDEPEEDIVSFGEVEEMPF